MPRIVPSRPGGLLRLGLAILAAGLALTPATAQHPGGTLTIVRPIDAVALDPQFDTSAHSAAVYGNVLESLLTLDDRLQIQPGLARSYEVLSPTRLRLRLRPNVRFHDGTPLTAAAVRFSFERALRGQPPARWVNLAGPLADAEVVDDATVDILTREPYGPILRTLAMPFTSIVSPTAVARLGEGFARAPVGTGPFRFVEWKTNTHIVIERNPDYWGEPGLLDRVVFRVLPEEGMRMLALRSGQADMVLHPAPSQLAAMRRDGDYTVHEVTSLRLFYVGMNTTAPPLDDPRVRRALLHAVDRRAIVDHILEGAALPVRSVIAPGVFGFKDMGIERLYPFDRTRARALLGQAGWAPGPDGMLWKDGRPLRLDFLATKGRHLKDREVTEALQAMLREIGVDAAVEFRDWAAQFQEVRAEPFRRHLFTWGWLTLTADADYGLYGPFHSKQPASGGNTARYANPQVDRLLDRARQSLDQAERLRLYGEVQDILAQDMVWLPMYAGKEIVVTRAHVKGFAPHPLEYTLDLRRTRLER